MNNLAINLEQPLWLLLPVLLVSITISAFLYYRSKNGFPNYLNIILFTLRFIVLVSLGILLLNPYFFKETKVLQKPVLVIAVDESESMLNHLDSLFLRKNIQSKIDLFQEELSQIYELDFLSYDHGIKEHLSLEFDGKRSDIGKLLSYATDKYYMLPTAGIVVLSDGQNNQGSDPMRLVENLSIGIYPLVYGDSSTHSDVYIDAVFHNKVVKQSAPFPVDVNVNAQGLQGEKLHLCIEKGGRLLQEKVIEITSPDFYKEIRMEVEANGEGLQAYRVKIRPLEGEKNIHNNQSDFYVQVLKSGNKILLLGHSPHPDLGALASSLRKVDGFELEVKTLSDYPFSLSDYQLLILHGLPSSDERSRAIFRNEEWKNKALWYIWASSTDLSLFEEKDFPWEAESAIAGYEYAELIANPDFSNFKMPNDWVRSYEAYPPLYTPFVKLQSRKKNDLMFSQSLRGFESGEVLLGLWNKGSLKRAYLAGEGLWKWRMHSFQNTHSHEEFNTLINRISGYLLTGVYNDRFSLQYQTVYNETDLVEWEAQVYNQAFETITNAEVSLIITDELGAEYPYQFTTQENGFYSEIGYLGAGEYHYRAQAQLLDTLLKDQGKFVVEAWNMEQSRIGADWKLMSQLALISGGEAYQEFQVNELIAKLKDLPEAALRYSFIQRIINFIDLRFIAFLLIALLTTEWVLRKRFGSY